MLLEGDIILQRDKLTLQPITWLAAIIRLATGCRYNHAMIVTCSHNQLFVNESNSKGVIKRPIQFAYKKNCELLVLRKQNIAKDFSSIADSYLGIKYDYKALFDQLWYRITGSKRWTGNTYNHSLKRLYCTEYAALAHGLDKHHLFTCKEFFNSDLFTHEKLQ